VIVPHKPSPTRNSTLFSVLRTRAAQRTFVVSRAFSAAR
jgi:hypothetical protein